MALGDIVHYAVTDRDAALLSQWSPSHARGHQAAVGRADLGAYPRPGETRPAMVVYEHGDGTVDLVVFLRGTGQYLAEAVAVGAEGTPGVYWVPA